MNLSFKRLELLNILIILILVFSLVITKSPLGEYLKVLFNNNFFIQFLAVLLGVFGGFVSNYIIESINLKRRIAGALEALRGEILSNTKAIEAIIAGMESIDCLVNPRIYTDVEAVKQMEESEKFIGEHAREALEDKIYTQMLNTLIELENKDLYERIINSYLETNKIKSVLLMSTISSSKMITPAMQRNARSLAEESFKLETQKLKELLTDITRFDKSVKEELIAINNKRLYRLFKV